MAGLPEAKDIKKRSAASDGPVEALVSTLALAPGWDPERQTLTHGDPGKRALALVNEAARKKRTR